MLKAPSGRIAIGHDRSSFWRTLLFVGGACAAFWVLAFVYAVWLA